jgi:hypothetical protein
MDSIARDRLVAAVEENPLRKATMGYQSRQFIDCSRPEWTPALLVAFAQKPHGGWRDEVKIGYY